MWAGRGISWARPEFIWNWSFDTLKARSNIVDNEMCKKIISAIEGYELIEATEIATDI